MRFLRDPDTGLILPRERSILSPDRSCCMSSIQQSLVAYGSSAGVGAMDPYTTDLWATGGIKKMLTAWAGSLIRVRRSSDDAEQDIGIGTAGALDTAGLATFGGSDSVFVKTIYDQSGNGNDIVQTTHSLQPRIVNAGTYDGFIRFDGTDDYMGSANSMSAVNAITVGGRYNYRALSGVQQLFSGDNAAVAAHNAFVLQHDNASPRFNGYIFNGAPSGPNYFQNIWSYNTASRGEIWVCDRANATFTERIQKWTNGALGGTSNDVNGTTTGAFTAEKLYVGGTPLYGQPAQLNLTSIVVWMATKKADGVAISNAL